MNTSLKNMTAAALGAAAVASAALLGCGGSDAGQVGGAPAGGSDQDQARGALVRLADAFVDADGEAACDLMTGDSKRQFAAAAAWLGGRGCEGAITASAELLDDAERRKLRDFRITSVKITGDTAIVATDADEDGPARLRKVDGDWLIDDLESAGRDTDW